MSRSPAWPHLRDLAPGDRVPDALYVLDYKDGTRPRWTVHSVQELASGGRTLVLIDPDNAEGRDLFGPVGAVAALSVITHPGKTMRSQPHQLGGGCGNTLCDMDQQGRHVAALVTAGEVA